MSTLKKLLLTAAMSVFLVGCASHPTLDRVQPGDESMSCSTLIAEVERLGGTHQEMIKGRNTDALKGGGGMVAASLVTSGLVVVNPVAGLAAMAANLAPGAHFGNKALKKNKKAEWALARRSHLSNIYNRKGCQGGVASSSASCFVTGLTANRIKEIQRELQVTDDGCFGPGSTEAFERDNQLMVTRRLEGATLEKFKTVYAP